VLLDIVPEDRRREKRTNDFREKGKRVMDESGGQRRRNREPEDGLHRVGV